MPPLLHNITKINTTTDEYGGYVEGGSVALNCHFREITNTDITNNPQLAQSDAICWLEPDSGVVEKDILVFNSEYYRVEKVIKARRLRNPNVVFLKCELQRQGEI